MKHTVFVTGGTGFIGSHTVERLLAYGYHVRCLIRPSQTKTRWLQHLPVDFVKGDLSDTESLAKCLKDVDSIIHIAGVTKARHRHDFFTTNVKATQNLLDASTHMRQINKFCFISSLTAVGPSKTGVPLSEEVHCHPLTSYGKSKLEAEHVCKRYMDRIPIVIIRPPAVFGPRDADILEMFKWVSHGIKPIIGSPEKTLSLVFAPDLAEGIVQTARDERTSGQIYNIADPAIFTFSSLIDYLATLVQKRTIHVHIPKGLVYSMAGITQFIASFGKKPAVLNIEKARDLFQKHWVCDPRKIREHIGFQTETPIFDGLKRTFEWYKEMGWL